MRAKTLVRTALGPFGARISRSHPRTSGDLPIEATEADRAIAARVAPFTLTGAARVWALLQSVRYLVANGIEGDLVECGVWRGGSSMAMALKLVELRDTERRLWMYDTFSGMTDPSEVDVEAHSRRHARQQMDRISGWIAASVEDVRANMASTGYPLRNVVFREGDVAETLRSGAPSRLALLRLDTDWYESTKVELEVLFPALVPGGVCIVDDYGHWEGARRALDEYLGEQGLQPLVHAIDYTGRLFVKQ